VGIVLATASSVLLALYMLFVRRTATHGISSEATFLLQLIAVVASSLLISPLQGDDWSAWTRLQTPHIIALVTFALVIVIGANLLQVYTLRTLGAPLVTAVQAWRLPMTAIVSGIVLGEWFQTPPEYIGAAITAGSVTWYLLTQRRLATRSA
jgi:drug/metabolite transporter (DMT)-like permease